MKINRLMTALVATTLLTASCRDKEEYDYLIVEKFPVEFLLANEGNFGTPTASITRVSEDLNKIEQNAYASANGGAPLGDVLQHIGFHAANAYMVLNNSNKVVVANRYSLKKEMEITTEIKNPRYVAFSNDLMYVTNVGNGNYMSIYKTTDNSFVKKIPFTDAAERVVEAGGKIFVQNASYGIGNKLTIVETTGNTIEKTITIPAGNINKTIANGGYVYTIATDNTNSYIYQYNPAGNLVKTTTLSGLKNATNLEIEGSNFYFSEGNKIYKMAMEATSVPANPLITVADNSWSTLYGMNVVHGKIFTADAAGFTEDSKIVVYDTSGKLLKAFTAGRGTNAAYVQYL